MHHDHPGRHRDLIYPNLNNPDLVFPTLAFDLLPIGLRGLVMAALIAAIMSSLDSALNAASSLVTMDFVAEPRPRTEQATLVKIGRIRTSGLVTENLDERIDTLGDLILGISATES